MSIINKLSKLDLGITNRCNYRCIHCGFNSGKNKERELSLAEIKDILVNISKFGCKELDITGGEPTLRKELERILETAIELKFKTKLITNGSLLTKKRLVYFSDIGLRYIAISLDGLSYEVHSSIRRCSEESYRKTLRTIEDCIELGIYTKINTVAFKTNLEELPRLIEYCINKGVNEHRICYFSPVGRGADKKKLMIEPLEWLDFVKKISKYSSLINLYVGAPIGKQRVEEGCAFVEGCTTPYISPEGGLYPCSVIASSCEPFAVLREEPFKEVWNNPKRWKEYWKKTYNKILDSCNIGIEYSKRYKFICPVKKYSINNYMKII